MRGPCAPHYWRRKCSGEFVHVVMRCAGYVKFSRRGCGESFKSLEALFDGVAFLTGAPQSKSSSS